MNAQAPTAPRLTVVPNRIRGFANRILHPSPPFRHAVRYGTATSLALWIAFAYGLPQHTWAAITVMMVFQPEAGASVQKSLLRLIGTAAAALISIPVAGLFAQEPPMMLACVFTIWAVAAYGMTGPRAQYAWSVFGMTAGIILIGALTAGDDIETFAFVRASMVALGVIIVFVVESLLWPNTVEQTLRTSLAGRIRDIGLTVRDAVAGFTKGEISDTTLPASSLATDLTLVDQLRGEIGSTPALVRQLGSATELIEALNSRAHELIRRLAEYRKDEARPGFRSLESWSADFATALDGVAVQLETREKTQAVDLDRLTSELEEIKRLRLRQLEAISQDESGRTTREMFRAAAFASNTAPILHDLTGLTEGLSSLWSKSDDDLAALEEKATGPTERPRLRLPELDPVRSEIALRAAIAATGATVAMLLLGWTPNAAAVTIAFILGTAPTRGGFKTVGLAILAIVMLAWAIADVLIVFVIPHIGRIPGALAIPFFIAGGFAYLGAKSPKLGALTPTLSLIVVLGLFGGSGPPTNVQGTYATTTYFVLAVFIAIFAQSILWPRRASDTFWRLAAGQLATCAKTLEAPEKSGTNAALLKAFATGKAKLAQFDGQAGLETEDDAEDAELRKEFLSRSSDLFDAAVHMRRIAATDAGEATPGTRLPGSLGATMRREEEALLPSIRAVQGALGGSPLPDSAELRTAGEAVAAAAADAETWKRVASELGVREIDGVLSELDAKHRVALRQIEIEDWVRRWSANR